jgi:hypothetical protein
MCARDSPFSPGAISIPTLVAIMTRLRAPDFFSQSPMIVSDSPPVCPGTQTEYTSAVSIRLSPDATKASRILNEAASSIVQPNTFPPSASGPTSIPDRPSARPHREPLRYPAAGAATRHSTDAPNGPAAVTSLSGRRPSEFHTGPADATSASTHRGFAVGAYRPCARMSRRIPLTPIRIDSPHKASQYTDSKGSPARGVTSTLQDPHTGKSDGTHIGLWKPKRDES